MSARAQVRQETLAFVDAQRVEDKDDHHRADKQDEPSEVNDSLSFWRNLLTAAQDFENDKQQAATIERW